MTKKPLSRAERSAAALRANLKRRKEGQAGQASKASAAGQKSGPPPGPSVRPKGAPEG